MSDQRFVETTVRYAVEFEGEFVLVENVPARVCPETGEQLFNAVTVERLQQTIWSKTLPARTVTTPVYDFVA